MSLDERAHLGELGKDQGPVAGFPVLVVDRSKISAMLDIYNVLNSDPVTNFNLNSGTAYKRVIAVLDPRVFQMGFRLEF